MAPTRPARSHRRKAPSASIVIRAFNEEAHLPSLFDALDQQSVREYEAIVVDSGSVDRTREIAETRGAKLLRIASHDFTFGYSLNAGIDAAKAPLVVIVSAHAIPVGPNWLAAYLSAFDDTNTAMAYGKQRGGKESKLGEARDLARTFGDDPLRLRAPDFFANNANAAIRRSLWQERQFDETLPGLEDIEWAKYWMEQGWAVRYEPAAEVLHLHDETWAQTRHRYRREAEAARSVGIRKSSDGAGVSLMEARRLVGDLAEAALHGRLSAAPSILRFRYEKVRGILSGLNGLAERELEKAKELLFEDYHQAVVIRGPGRAELEAVRLPLPRPGEVLVRVAYEGVCATDLEVLSGRLDYFAAGLSTYPIVPGHEVSGTVASVGARVTGWHHGDRVVVECIQSCGTCDACAAGNFIGCKERRELGVMRLDGGYAEYLVAPSKFVHQVPQELSLHAASLCEPAAVVVKGLRRLRSTWPEPGAKRRCVVVGAGPIGHLAARFLALEGHEVTVYDQDPGRLRPFNGSSIATSENLPDAVTKCEALVEATGDASALHTALEASAPGSTVLLLGLPYARREFSFEAIVGYDKTIVGSVGSEGRDFETALSILSGMDLDALTERTIPLAEFQRAWELTRTHAHLKVTLEVDPAAPG